MKLLGSILLLSSVALVAHGYTCPSGKSKKVIKLGMDQSEDLETQEGDKYGKNVNCKVIFKKKNKNLKCNLEFSCDDFALIAKKPTCKGGSDFFVINRKKYCGENSPEVETTKMNLAVLFKSNKRSKGDAGAICTATCVSEAATTAAPVTAAPTTAAPITAAPTTAGGPGVTVPNLPNPGSAGGTFEITIVQSWSQETDYPRVTEVKVPATEAGVKLPVIIDLHGNGGSGNTGRLSYLGDNVIIAAPNGYERSWNVNAEKSKADDVAFLLELIQKVVEENPAADANDVTLLGTSNGAAITYRMLIETGIDRPFHRAIPMVSSLISVQYNDGKFYASAGPDTTTNDYTVETAPVFADNFEYFHFHGTEDGALAYEGKCPGPGFLGAGVCVVPAQETDFAFAAAMGYTGAQIPDADGVSVGDDMLEYSYLGGRVKHFKDIGGTHGSTFGDSDTEAQVKMIFGVA